jgi:hypothetical protein
VASDGDDNDDTGEAAERREASAANKPARRVVPVSATVTGRSHFDELPTIRTTKVTRSRNSTSPNRYSARAKKASAARGCSVGTSGKP